MKKDTKEDMVRKYGYTQNYTSIASERFTSRPMLMLFTIIKKRIYSFIFLFEKKLCKIVYHSLKTWGPSLNSLYIDATN